MTRYFPNRIKIWVATILELGLKKEKPLTHCVFEDNPEAWPWNPSVMFKKDTNRQ